MTTITRVTLSQTARRAARAMASPEVLHAIVARATEPAEASGRTGGAERQPDERTLWRLDRGRGLNRLFIVSPGRPSLEVLSAELTSKPEAVTTLDYAPLLRAVTAGSEWRFRLKANPTKSLSQGEGHRGRRVGLLKDADQLAWLTARAQQLGVEFPVNRFGLPEVVVRDSHLVDFRRGTATVTLATAVFDGFLTVRDPELVKQALTTGVGRAKGYGYGLLTLARPQGAEADG